MQAQSYLKRVLDPSPGAVHIARMGNRLSHLRKKAGLSQEALGKALNSGRSTVTKLERSEIPMTDRWLDRLSVVLNCSPVDILGDEVPVVGKIGAGGSVIFEDLGADYVTRRPPDTYGELIGLEVVGDSMLPKFDSGDIVYISRSYDGIDPSDVGADCACRLLTGETYLKRLAKGSKPGSYTLRSYNAPDMEDVELEWATPIRASIPRHARRYS
jgi:repressor LexA